MTHDPRTEEPFEPRRAAPPLVRSFCPRCGARLGVLSAGAADRGPTARADDAGGVAGATAASALYCGCCGLVVPAT